MRTVEILVDDVEYGEHIILVDNVNCQAYSVEKDTLLKVVENDTTESMIVLKCARNLRTLLPILFKGATIDAQVEDDCNEITDVLDIQFNEKVLDVLYHTAIRTLF